MLEPFLDGFRVLVGDNNPIVTETAENAFGIKFPNIGVLGKELVSFLKRVYVFVISTEYVNNNIITEMVTPHIPTFSWPNNSCDERPMGWSSK